MHPLLPSISTGLWAEGWQWCAGKVLCFIPSPSSPLCTPASSPPLPHTPAGGLTTTARPSYPSTPHTPFFSSFRRDATRFSNPTQAIQSEHFSLAFLHRRSLRGLSLRRPPTLRLAPGPVAADSAKQSDEAATKDIRVSCHDKGQDASDDDLSKTFSG